MIEIMNEALEEAVDRIKVMQTIMSGDGRKKLWNEIMNGYCKHCGEADPEQACQCWNDE